MSTAINEEDQFKKLSHDLLVFLTHLETAYNEIEESEEKEIIQEWLQFILKHHSQDVASARLRNMALSKMLMDIESSKLMHPFNERPSHRLYTELIDTLKIELDQNLLNENEEHHESTLNDRYKNHELDLDEFDNIMSADNRTYVAIRNLPNDGGLFGYIAITMGEGRDTQWLDTKGRPIPTPVASYLPVDLIKTDGEEEEEEEECEESDAIMVWNVLQDQSALCLRSNTLEFYKKLYSNIEQEMLAEKNNVLCTHPLINKLLKYLEVEFKGIGITDIKMFRRLKMLSILKKQVKTVLIEIENRTDTLDTATKVSLLSPVSLLPRKCCYDFVSSTLSNEIYKNPVKKYMELLSIYPEKIFPKYFAALEYDKKRLLASIVYKYCNIMDEMFADLGKSLMSDLKKYRDSKWEWHLAHEVLDAYKKEKAYKDSLCVVDNSADETTDTFLTVILNEIGMAQEKLRSLVRKNDKLAQQLPELRNQIADTKRAYQTIITQNEEKICKLTQEINFEKRDILKRTNTISELESRLNELKKK